MRSDRTYFLKIAVATNGKKEVEKVLYAQCKRCPAGKEPFATCKHIAAFFLCCRGIFTARLHARERFLHRKAAKMESSAKAKG